MQFCLHASAALLLPVFFAPTLLAQATLIVNAGGGPGVFVTVQDAVNAAADGDTIIVQEWFGSGADGFTTNKGLTILGETGYTALGTRANDRIEVSGLPAGSVFRMAGFSRPSNGEIHIELNNCAGSVHLERMVAREFGFFFPTTASVTIDNCASVTMREFVNFGSPAVQVADSHLLLVDCQLGRTPINLPGGQALVGSNATIDIVQPRFDTTLNNLPNSILTTNCALTIAGDSTSYVINTGGPVIDATGGTVRLDPAVMMVPGSSFPVVTGSATVTSAKIPATWNDDAIAGQLLTITASAPAGAGILQALGMPAPLAIGPLGTLGIDLMQPFAFFPLATVGASGFWTGTVAVPPQLPPGTALTTQSLLFGAALPLQIGLPSAFVVR